MNISYSIVFLASDQKNNRWKTLPKKQYIIIILNNYDILNSLKSVSRFISISNSSLVFRRINRYSKQRNLQIVVR